ncbi:PREDICTED: cytochrome P450 CYP72A219-like [Ipomoea nil]|uniref:cytochrome P450 CYP72A219-like n=1 Tax=Ipomoea nil TaxID=35883 RepID=UPI000901C565|nr:PREDICTED: cytochrome P450 CYP72A219-like [Ipomoea nil]
MEILYNSTAVLFAIILSRFLYKFLDWVWVKPRRIERLFRQQGFSGNSYKPLIGDLVEIARSTFQANRCGPLENLSNDIAPRILPFLHNAIRVYGKKSFLWFGTAPSVIITEPGLIKEMLANYTTFHKPNRSAMLEVARGLFACEADRWQMNKRIINPAFHIEKLKVMVPAFYKTSREMVDKWDNIVKPEGSEVNVGPYLSILTSDAIARTAFGSNFEEGRNIFHNLDKLTMLINELGPFAFIPQYWALPTKMKMKIQKKAREVRGLVQEVVVKRMEEVRAGKATASTADLLGILLESNLEEIRNNGNMNKGLSMDEVIEECKLFYFGGQETTTNLIGWTLIYMGKHLEWQQRLRDEIMQAFGPVAAIQSCDFHKLSHLKIMNMILNEILRLYPLAPVLSRETREDTKLGNIKLPAGVHVVVPLISLHRDKDLWGGDALEFKPERFKDGISKASNTPGAYFPFGGGPRICIGQNYALVEAKVALIAILQRFSVQLSPSYKHYPEWVLTLQPRSIAVNLILRKL